MSSATDDYYAVLGVDRRATPEEIKKAFRRLTLEWHPDRHQSHPGGEPEAAERYRQINEAYNTLGDAARRSRYDMTQRLEGIELRRGGGGQSARDLLGNVFGDVFGTRRDKRRRGRDLRYTLTVSFEDAVLGSSHDIEFEAPGPCSACEGTGTRPGIHTDTPAPVWSDEKIAASHLTSHGLREWITNSRLICSIFENVARSRSPRR